jgi:hypothetical protein
MDRAGLGTVGVPTCRLAPLRRRSLKIGHSHKYQAGAQTLIIVLPFPLSLIIVLPFPLSLSLRIGHSHKLGVPTCRPLLRPLWPQAGAQTLIIVIPFPLLRALLHQMMCGGGLAPPRTPLLKTRR